MATHPYPTAANLPPERTWLESDGRLAVTSFAAYREVRRVMLANGDDKPLWFTEFGWSTNTLVDQGVSESTQAAYYTRAMQCVEQDPYVDVAIWYLYRNRFNNADTWLGQLGLVRTDFSKKLAYNAFKSYTPGSVGCTYQYGTPPPPPPPPPPHRHRHRRLSRRPCRAAPTRARRPSPSRRLSPSREPVDPSPRPTPRPTRTRDRTRSSRAAAQSTSSSCGSTVSHGQPEAAPAPERARKAGRGGTRVERRPRPRRAQPQCVKRAEATTGGAASRARWT